MRKSCCITQPGENEYMSVKFDLSGFFYKWGTILTVIFLIAFFGIVAPNFLTYYNMVNILRSISIVTVVAIGVSMSLSVGGFDLSVGSVASLANAVIVSCLIWYNLPTFPSILIALTVCLFVGLFNAFLIIIMKIPDMLATLASMFIIQGVAMTYTKGGSITQNMMMANGSTAPGSLTPVFNAIGQVPTIIIIMLCIVVIVQIFLSFTKYGRFMYMVGGNAEAARLSGIPCKKYKLLAYLISSFFAAVGGIMLASRIGSSQVNSGSAYLMDAVAAAYIGYSLAGNGKPNAVGTFIGAVLIGILQNGLVMISVPYYSMDIVKGLVLALALAITYLRKEK